MIAIEGKRLAATKVCKVSERKVGVKRESWLRWKTTDYFRASTLLTSRLPLFLIVQKIRKHCKDTDKENPSLLPSRKHGQFYVFDTLISSRSD